MRWNWGPRCKVVQFSFKLHVIAFGFLSIFCSRMWSAAQSWHPPGTEQCCGAMMRCLDYDVMLRHSWGCKLRNPIHNSRLYMLRTRIFGNTLRWPQTSRNICFSSLVKLSLPKYTWRCDNFFKDLLVMWPWSGPFQTDKRFFKSYLRSKHKQTPLLGK